MALAEKKPNQAPPHEEKISRAKVNPHKFKWSLPQVFVLLGSTLCPFWFCNHLIGEETAGPEVIKLFSYSTQLSMKFQMLIKSMLLNNKDFICFQTLRCCVYNAHKY